MNPRLPVAMHAVTGRSIEATVLYDGDCGFCRWCVDRILAWDRSGKIDAVPIQSQCGAELLVKIDARVRLESWHVATPDGRVFSGGAAAPELLDLLPGGRPLARLFRRFPAAVDAVYRLIARNRRRLGRWTTGEVPGPLRRRCQK